MVYVPGSDVCALAAKHAFSVAPFKYSACTLQAEPAELPVFPPATDALDANKKSEAQLGISAEGVPLSMAGGLGGSTRQDALFSMTLAGSDGGDAAPLRRGSSEIMCAVETFTLHPFVLLERLELYNHTWLPNNRLPNNTLSSHHCCSASCVTVYMCRMYVPAAPQPGSPIPPMPEPFEESEPTQLDLPRPLFESGCGDFNIGDSRCVYRAGIAASTQC